MLITAKLGLDYPGAMSEDYFRGFGRSLAIVVRIRRVSHPLCNRQGRQSTLAAISLPIYLRMIYLFPKDNLRGIINKFLHA